MKLMRIFNGTPHMINIIDKSSCYENMNLRKLVSSEPVYLHKIPTNKVLNVEFKTTHVEGIIFKNEIVSINELPKHYGIYIVSALYASAYSTLRLREPSKLYTVCDTVYDSDGKTILGCIGLCKSEGMFEWKQS